ncbi:hypothetical protein [Bacillus sp. V5-8f]|uniref:hypothetical protein n=1 Tax=Bacillus sp. V5-8f TaxID=2053044 RepID=UPI000C7815C3|nr:hypothetical protein [Bacillus sp. V5-8f]PLT34105.1 hypothetical protein CUU64_07660 [Bacillus sp. V5-8f]
MDRVEDIKKYFEHRQSFSESARKGLELVQIIEELHKTIRDLRKSTRFRVYEENLALVLEVQRLKVVEQAYEALKRSL